MLESNLVRQGLDLAFETDLIYLDVNNNRVGIKTDIPFRPLVVNNTIRTTNLLVDTALNIPNFTFSSNNITNQDNNILLSASGIGATIRAKILQNDGLQLDTNRIISLRSNENIDIFSNGTGQIIFNNNVEVFANLHATGNITFDGNIVLGDSNTDNVTFNSDITSDIIPDVSNLYSLGSTSKKWKDLRTNLVNGTSYNSGGLLVNNIDLSTRPGNIWFVSTTGSNSNVGDHENGPFATIQHALSNATNGDTVYIYPGTYMENFPLTVPVGVTVKGSSIRSVKIIPQASSNDQDAFLLNGETTITDLTIGNFFYNSVANTGYAFKFASGFAVTTRSPYIQNVSVITENESTLASAGRGAYIDGSVANSASVEASMLFYSATFITPNADCIIMKNGVRVEWLNSFIYFANRGLYAENGTLGFAGLGIKYGAELRSIGSANVYGNYGAWADGNKTLMYLINHNFGYIGSGLDSNNDPTEVIQANEIVTLNNGKIYYQSVDHKGDFRVGEILRVESSTGNIEFQTSVFSTSSINLFDGTNTTYIDSGQVTTGNITISGNTIQSTLNEINLNAANNQISITSNTFIDQSLEIMNNISINGNTIFGNNNSDNIVFNNQIINSLIPFTNGTYTLGSSSNRWKQLYSTATILDDIIIDTNFITTTQSNSNLELRANGLGNINVNDSLFVFDNLTVSASSSLSNVTLDTLSANNIQANNLISVATTNTFDDIQFNGNRISTIVSNADLELVANGAGSVIIKDNFNVQQDLFINGNTLLKSTTVTNAVINNLFVQTNLSAAEFFNNDIIVDNNFITTTQSNSNLELRANGTGIVDIQDSLTVDNNTTVLGTTNLQNINVNGTTTTNSANASNSITSNNFSNGNIAINDNFITTNQLNNNLNLFANGSGLVRFADSVLVESTLDVTQSAFLQNTNINGLLTVPNIVVPNNVSTSQFYNSDILINTNFITTTLSNSNLEFRAQGINSGIIVNQILQLRDSNLTNLRTTGTESQRSIELIPTTNNNLKINSNVALRLPIGNNADRILTNLGEIRLNNSNQRFEGRVSTGTRQLYGLFDQDQNTFISAELAPGVNDNIIRMVINGTTRVTVTEQNATFDNLKVDDVLFNLNSISTINSNANLELQPSGTGIINIKDNFEISTSKIKNYSPGSATLIQSNGPGYVKFNGDKALVIPVGTTVERLASPPLGSSRWNTTTSQLEVWDGTVWTGPSGQAGTFTAADMDDLVNILTLVLG